MDDPLLQREEGIRLRDGHAVHKTGGGHHGIRLKAQRRDGDLLVQLLPQGEQRRAAGRLICRAAGFQQGVGLFIREAAVVQTALRADKRPDVPVSRQAALAVVQVKAPVPQALKIRLPWHGVTVTDRPQRLRV